ncbi:SH3 domain-containing protein [Christensenellaceae bacterium OttesenSCG-928-L17]|nr:SH3 domain-containing protein [Christensenellaceae bacterium OttesenSCG-928-L17]
MRTKTAKHVFALLLAAAMLWGCFAPIALAEETAAVLGTAKTTGSVNLREGPSLNDTALLKVSKGKKVDVLSLLEYYNGWVNVRYNGQEGYIAAEFLELGSLTPPAIEAGVIKSSTKLYPEANAKSRALLTLAKLTDVEILDSVSNAKFWQIRYTNKSGKEYIGFVATSSIQKGTSDDLKTSNTKTSIKKATTVDVNAEKIAAAKKKNSDTVGWISVPNTNVDEPILYAPNFYYANHDINKKKSYDGVYPYTSRATSNIVVFGHNMRGSGSIFHQLHHLQESAQGYTRCRNSSCGRTFPNGLGGWYKTSAGRTFNVSLFGTQKWEVFAMYEVPKNEPISTLRNNWNVSPSNMQTWVNGQIARSEIDFGVKVSKSDQVLTLITCGTNYDSSTANSRLFVFLKNVD